LVQDIINGTHLLIERPLANNCSLIKIRHNGSWLGNPPNAQIPNNEKKRPIRPKKKVKEGRIKEVRDHRKPVVESPL